MSLSDDDFVEMEDEDFFASSPNKHHSESMTEHSSPRPAKRRCLTSSYVGGSEDVLDHPSSQVSASLFVSQASEAGFEHEDEDMADSIELPETPDKKRKLKAHVPKHDKLYEDAFRTQLPRSSESPYRIRGPIWQKPCNLEAEESPEYGQLQRESRASPVLRRQSDSDCDLMPQKTVQLGRSKTYPIQAVPPSPDAFDITDEEEFGEIMGLSSTNDQTPSYGQQGPKPRLVGPQRNLKQTTLFGTQSAETINAEAQTNKKYAWPLADKQETPTHHKLNGDALVTWVYPTNLGAIREYQFNIVARGLYHNLLVALPTGLGKTFIAATVMLNWFRWTKEAQIVFVAPTKPLVSQQVEACFNIAGIPRSATTMLTGGIPPGVRAQEWLSKRVFFMTPQTFINDLKTGICDPKKIVLVVVDEAHRATGGYAYVEVVSFLRRFNSSFRVLALTATPGSTVESVQAVIDGLGISKVEIRTEESLDIRQYVHPRKIETMEFEPSDEMQWIFEKLSKALQPLVDLMRGKNAYWSKDPMSLTAYGCNQSRQKWMSSDAGRKASQGEKGQVMWVFATLASIAHSIELLKYHGITPFYHKLVAFRDGDKDGKYAKQVKDHQEFKDIMARVRIWVMKPEFIGHPKLDYLQGVVMEHFVSASEGRHPDPEISPNKTRIMIFAHFRDSAEEIVRVLNRNNPMIRAHVFVGQASASRSDGMNQKKQLEVIDQFRKGIYNTIVATSIGEEGLDIGEVDLIICYDASASPIRMLQRMGRTGRKRAGEIVVLLMKGKEANNFAAAKDNYEKMQLMIADGQRFTFHTNVCPRIVPKEIQPIVDKRIVEIPLENSQATLPEPSRKGRAPKRPPKKFNMPDGVRTGFVTAANIDGDEDMNEDDIPVRELKRKNRNEKDASEKKLARGKTAKKKRPARSRSVTPVPVPPLASVILTSSEQMDLERNYLQIAGEDTEVVESPRLDAWPNLQRLSRPTGNIKHGKATLRMQQMLRNINEMDAWRIEKFQSHLDPADKEISRARFKERSRSNIANALGTGLDKTVIAIQENKGSSTGSVTPKAVEKKQQLFWESPGSQNDIEPSQDLPDLTTILGLSSTTDSRSKITATRRKRLVIDSDSDE